MSMRTFGVFNNHPIPGQSLTKQPGANIAQTPPQFADPNEALEFVFDKLTDPRFATRLILILKKGVSAEYIARALIFDGFTKGKWTPDVGLLMLRVVMAQILSIAKLKGIKATVFNKDKEQDKFLDDFLDEAPQNKQEEETTATPELTAKFTGVLGGVA